MPKKLTQEQVAKIFEKEGCKLLSEHKGNKTPLEYVCSCGTKSSIRLDKFRDGQRCRKCASKKIIESQMYTFEQVKKVFESKGCTLLSKEYKGLREKLDFMCRCGKQYSTTFGVFKNYNGHCKECRYRSVSEKMSHDIEYVKEYFSSHECTLLSDEYKNDRCKLKYICSCGNTSYTNFVQFRRGKRCANCSVQRQLITMSKNGNVNTSKQQIFINSLIGGELNFPIGSSCLDIAFPDDKIYVEYDGGGHRLSVLHGTTTNEDFDKKERARTYALYERGWKCIRIFSSKDLLPNDNVLKKVLLDSFELISGGRSWVKINIDNSTIETSMFIRKINLGELRRI